MSLPKDLVLKYMGRNVLTLGWPDSMSITDFGDSDVTVWDLPHVNLNYERPSETYDLVLDPGTCEHVANIGNALRLMMEACATKGVILQMTALTMFNHGYYNISPNLLRDLYEVNGFEIELWKPVYVEPEMYSGKINLFDRQQDAPNEVALIVMARRQRWPGWIWPIQAQYRADTMRSTS